MLFLVPCVAWAMASPVHSVPDEPDQVRRAASLWDGQILGSRVASQPSVVRSIDVDGRWNGDVIPCFAFHPDTLPADCPPAFPADRSRVSTTTYDGAFPPSFYALVGWPTQLQAGRRGFYGMRLVAAALSAALLASALLALDRVLPRALAVFGVAAATTPMVFFLAGSVNPSGLEISAAVALWAHVLAISSWPSHRPSLRLPTSLIVGLAASGGLLTLSRFLSPGFAFLIGVLALTAATGTWSTLRSLLRDRRLLVAVAVVGICAVGGLALTLSTGALQGLSGGVPHGVDNPWLATLGLSSDFLRQMLGWFGWLDTPTSPVTEIGWLLVIGALLGVATVVGKGRTVLALLATILLTVVVPVVIQAPRLLQYGLTWQGRHGLPLAVGVPLLAVFAAGQRVTTQTGNGLRRLAIAGVSVIAVVQVHALWWALHRYVVGLHSRLLGLTGGRWQPPAGSLFWLAIMTVFGVALVAFVVCSPTPEPSCTDKTLVEPSDGG